ncbi:hypothetical protein CBW65_14590 [Tumebacillus avium]|uniref:Uncharacterized protein n=1 Tax=Tumebacillus avium TaxID=1903704 RepID=A0A1Y0IND6_9BACL|nr:hypothetical protein [Tumebacillus avium]ARU62092.1 hypothetical protein CBW65_14590 [Tumebacillus avium]
MQINVTELKVTTIDKGFLSIGPSVQNVVRGRQHSNQGIGQIKGDLNYTEAERTGIDDRDVIDFPIRKIHLNVPGNRR